MVKTVGFKEKVAKVKGINSNRKDVEFSLTPQEIKHIRRTMITWDRLFSRDYENPEIIKRDLTRRLYFKFQLFGRIKRKMNRKSKKNKIRKMEGICSFKGCQEKENLTLDHLRRLSNEENGNVDKNLQLLCPKHHLLKELRAHLFHKNLEVRKLKKRIEEIEKKGTTDCLGYQILSKNKFVNEEKVEIDTL